MPFAVIHISNVNEVVPGSVEYDGWVRSMSMMTLYLPGSEEYDWWVRSISMMTLYIPGSEGYDGWVRSMSMMTLYIYYLLHFHETVLFTVYLVLFACLNFRECLILIFILSLVVLL